MHFGNPFTWGQTRRADATAQIRRPLLDGTFCRNIVFDNNTSQSITDKVERCDATEGRAGRDVVRNKPSEEPEDAPRSQVVTLGR